MIYHVYGIYWQGICVYVGVTIHPAKRLEQHRNPTRGKLRDLPGLTIRVFRSVPDHIRAAGIETQITRAFWRRGWAMRNHRLTPKCHSQTIVPAKRVVCLQTGIEYPSLAQAGRAHGISGSTITAYIGDELGVFCPIQQQRLNFKYLP